MLRTSKFEILIQLILIKYILNLMVSNFLSMKLKIILYNFSNIF